MTAEEANRARHSLRLLLESDLEFGLDEVFVRIPEANALTDPRPEPDRLAADAARTPRAPDRRADRPEDLPSDRTVSADALRDPASESQRTEPVPREPGRETRGLHDCTAQDLQAVDAQPTGFVPRRDRLPDVRTDVPRLTLHDGDPERRRRMDALEDEIHACAACGLCQGRKTPVAGEGSVSADLMFVGEGPGGDEDRSGRPFVGAAGVLLSKIIEAMGFNRESVFIANAVKCRPPQNRTPVDTELAACRPFLERQIAIVQPKVICALGRPAAQALLQTTRGINALRGKVLPLSGPGFDGMVVVPTFHPAYLLRRPEDKGKTWSDVQIAAKQVVERGGSIPAQGALPLPRRSSPGASGDTP